MPTQQTLPMTVETLLDKVIRPALAGKYLSDEAIVLLIAIALQESGLRTRWQIINPLDHSKKGPARGLWQFERGGGCAGVMRHEASRQAMVQACMDHKVVPDAFELFKALELDDILACKAARLFLYTDSQPLPKMGDVKGSWKYYLRVWGPGKPHEKTWGANYASALEAIQ